MFENLYKDPATIAKYQRAPLLEDRERYLRSVVASVAVRDVARRVARAQLVLMPLLSLPDADIPIRLATVERSVQEWCRSRSRVSAADFRCHALRWLRFLGWLDEPPRDTHPHVRQVETFAAWMRDERGLSEATVGNCLYSSHRFFAWAARLNLVLADIAIGDVDAYRAERIAAGGLRRTSARAAAERLRSLVRFAETRHWCRPGIAGCIMPPQAYPDRPVRKGFDRDEVEQLLATTEGSTPADLRDRAVLMLLATCGLRAGEVSALRVEDVDWERSWLRVFRPKTGRGDTFPLTPSLGHAWVDYLLKARPDAGRERALFLTLRAPRKTFAPVSRDDRPQSREARWHCRQAPGCPCTSSCGSTAADRRGLCPEDRWRFPRPFQPARDSRLRHHRSRLAAAGRRHPPQGAAQ